MKTVYQRIRRCQADLCKSVLSLFCGFDFTAELSSHRLHAVTNTQNRAIQVEYFLIGTRCVTFCDRRRTA